MYEVEQFQGKTADDFWPWIMTIFRNHLTDGLRRYRYSAKRAPDREDHDAPTVAADDESPSAYAMAEEEVDRLLTGIQQLPSRSQKVVRLRYLEDRTYAEIAQELQCSTDMARRIWLKAIDQLSQELES
ncbi:MAG: sigma-70 family RNA polymerase sigma factor [Planctomycetota bacterium]